MALRGRFADDGPHYRASRAGQGAGCESVQANSRRARGLRRIAAGNSADTAETGCSTWAGAFTDARSKRIGRFEAFGGTLFPQLADEPCSPGQPSSCSSGRRNSRGGGNEVTRPTHTQRQIRTLTGD
jgi:hypothetical protein